MVDLDAATGRIRELEEEIQKLKGAEVETHARLRHEGLEKGAKGVKAAFGLIAFVFIVSVAFEFYTGRPLQAAPNLIGLGGVLCVALVAYFGFIFKYTLAAELSKERLTINTNRAR